jgi:hypothetical protein
VVNIPLVLLQTLAETMEAITCKTPKLNEMIKIYKKSYWKYGENHASPADGHLKVANVVSVNLGARPVELAADAVILYIYAFTGIGHVGYVERLPPTATI